MQGSVNCVDVLQDVLLSGRCLYISDLFFSEVLEPIKTFNKCPQHVVAKVVPRLPALEGRWQIFEEGRL